MSASRTDDLPCGKCEAGVYHEIPVENGLRMFGSCRTQKEALKLAPMCKRDPKHICFGARDWIVAAKFPFTGIA